MQDEPSQYPSLPDPWWKKESAPNPPSAGSASPEPVEGAAPTPPGSLGHSEAFRDGIEFFPNLHLDSVQLRAIELTVQCHTDTQIAEMLGINRKTIWRWKNFDDNYRRALENVRMQTHAAVIDRFSNLLIQSSSIFAKLLRDASEDKQFRAAQTLINMAGSFRPLRPKLPPPPKQSSYLPDPDSEPEPLLEPKVG